jgi:hypothetical protein
MSPQGAHPCGHDPIHSSGEAVFIGPVSCTSPSACTTTGLSVDSSGLATTLAERWNGTAWRIQPTPNPPGAQSADLDGGVACTGPSACLAVGTSDQGTLAEQWNGVTWHIVPSPTPRRAVAGSGPFPVPRPRPAPPWEPRTPGPWPSGGTAPGGRSSPRRTPLSAPGSRLTASPAQRLASAPRSGTTV